MGGEAIGITIVLFGILGAFLGFGGDDDDDASTTQSSGPPPADPTVYDDQDITGPLPDDGTVTGTPLNDLIFGGQAVDGPQSTQDPGVADDTIKALAGQDTIFGGVGDDEIDDGLGNDSVFGGAGADQVILSGGDDTLDGGADVDTLSGVSITDDITLDITAGTASSASTGADQFSNFEVYETGDGNDTVSGDGSDNIVRSGEGNDSLTGAGGDDILNSGGGDDTLSGGAGMDTVTTGTGMDVIVADDGTTITDFDPTSDFIDLTGQYTTLQAAKDDLDANGMLTQSGPDGIELTGIGSSDLTTGNTGLSDPMPVFPQISAAVNGAEITFSANLLAQNPSSNYTYLWQLGNGQTSTSPTATVDYFVQYTILVSLQVTSTTDPTDTSTQFMTIDMVSADGTTVMSPGLSV